MGKFKSILIFGGMVSLVIGAHIRAEEISVPYPFSPGTTIRSSEMNENFTIIYQKFNELQFQITRLKGYHIPTDGLVAYYPFNGNANDESGNGNHGTVHNGVTLAADRFGNANMAYNFNGADGCVLVDDNDTLDIQNSISITTWIKSDRQHSGIYGMIIAKHHTHNERSYTLFDVTTLDPNYGIDSGLGVSIIDQNNNLYWSGTPTYDSQWHFVVSVYDYALGDLSLYIDGQQNVTKSIGQIKFNANICTSFYRMLSV